MDIKGDFIALSFQNGTLDIISSKDGTPFRSLENIKNLSKLIFHKNLIALTSNKKLLTWEYLKPNSEAIILGKHISTIKHIAADKNFVVSASFDGEVNVWSLSDRSRLQSFKTDPLRISQLVIKDNLIVTASERGPIKLWSLSKGTLIKKLINGYGPVKFLAINGRNMISYHKDNNVVIWFLGSTDLIKIKSVELELDRDRIGNFNIQGNLLFLRVS